mmetsp:Transcript_22862/g.32728  ORF Transcript_22862/g.32728 Transcript_22862/m.32728 type:complete len:144 (-) Transcript_22862:87-518(-)
MSIRQRNDFNKRGGTSTPRKNNNPLITNKNKNKNKNKKQPSSTADEARSITKSLRRTQNLLSQELHRVAHVSEAIDADGKLLGDTKETHLVMNDTVKGANAALRNLELQKRKETLVLTGSMVFFFLVVAYVLWTRIRIPFILW